MTRHDFLNAIIDEGIAEINYQYTRPEQEMRKLGGIKGFEACRDKNDTELLSLLDEAKVCVQKAMGEAGQRWYWHWLMYQRQIEWTLNVLSAALREHGRPPLTDCTLRGYMKAATILKGKSYDVTTH